MRAFKFSKPKTPGFGIDKRFYLSILSTKPAMPPILEAINPRGQGGAVEGFGAPLAQGTPKEALGQPMERGAYVIASKDQKTVLKMLVLSKEEAGFDPEPLLRSTFATQLEPEVVARIRATWQVAQLTFESHDPMVYPSLNFLLLFCMRLGLLTEGVIADPISQRYLLPQELMAPVRVHELVDARELVSIRHRVRPEGIHAFTLGLQKFGLPEYELTGLFESDLQHAESLLLSASQSALLGKAPVPGSLVGSPKMPFEVREGGFDQGLWHGVPCLELLPPTRNTAGEALEAWAAELAQ